MALKAYNKVSEEERAWAYHLSMDRAEADYNNGIMLAKQNGISLGEQQHACDMARRMLSKGKYSLEEIAEMTGLSMEKIQSLQEV